MKEQNMSKQLVDIITEQTVILLHNVNTTIQTCDMEYTLCEMPIWKHVYHMLHSLDQWFINPNQYQEPSIQKPNLNSLDIKSDTELTKEELISYYNLIKEKIMRYMESLNDNMLSEKPEGCKYSRLALILGQYRHLNCHLGNINCTTIIQTDKWPKVVGLDGNLTKELYE